MQNEFSPKSLTYKGLQATSTDTEENRDEQSSSEASETTHVWLKLMPATALH